MIVRFRPTCFPGCASESGGSAGTAGSVTTQQCHALLREGDSFTVSLQRTITIPAAPSELAFQIEAPAFDATSTGRISDAVELALVDDLGRPLVHTVAVGRDAFFNWTDGQPAQTGANAQFDGSWVTLDLSHIQPGTAATVIVRLVNNDGDTQSTARLLDFELRTGIGGGTSGAVIEVPDYAAH